MTQYESSAGDMGGKLMFMLLGGAIGATAALMTTQKTGSQRRAEICSQLADANRRGYSATDEFIDQLQNDSAEYYKTKLNESEEYYRSLKDKANEVYTFAAGKLSQWDREAREAANTGSSGGKNYNAAKDTGGGASLVSLPDLLMAESRRIRT
jgi:gas vesicle protein